MGMRSGGKHVLTGRKCSMDPSEGYVQHRTNKPLLLHALQLCVAVMTMCALLSALLFDNDYVLNERTDKLHQPFEKESITSTLLLSHSNYLFDLCSILHFWNGKQWLFFFNFFMLFFFGMEWCLTTPWCTVLEYKKHWALWSLSCHWHLLMKAIPIPIPPTQSWPTPCIPMASSTDQKCSLHCAAPSLTNFVLFLSITLPELHPWALKDWVHWAWCLAAAALMRAVWPLDCASLITAYLCICGHHL